MANFISIDMGTSNTRLYLIKDCCIVDKIKYPIGASAGMITKDPLKQALREGIITILEKNSLCEKNIECILASGMITSEGGLYELSHIKAPCGIIELANNMHKCVIEDVSQIPFVFSRGVIIDTHEIDQIDMMRGEETELFGLTEVLETNCLYVLLGTHSKMIFTNSLGRIVNFKTALSGDMISAISQNTVLKNSVLIKPYGVNLEYLHKGYVCAKKLGIGTALFKVRILDKILGAKEDECYNFFLGAIFQAEIDSIIQSKAQKVLISGKFELRAPFTILLSENTDKNVIEIDDQTADNATALGIIRLYKEYIKSNDK